MTPPVDPSLDPRPRHLYSGAKRHIARPDHPTGRAATTIAFCGANASTEDPRANPVRDLAACKRCAVAWVAYVDRLARERDEALEDAAFAALDDLEEER